MTPQFHPSYRMRPTGRGAPYVLDRYSSDQSGPKTYQFNSLGYRGRDFNPSAKRNLFVFGCSHTFGVGLNQEELWSHHFANRYAAHCGISRDELNLMNFAHEGASNEEIARNVLMQCTVHKPDLAVMQITQSSRFEIALGDKVAPIGSWTPKAGWETPELRAIASDLYLNYTHEQELHDTLLTVLLAQNFFVAQGIDYFMLAVWKVKNPTPIAEALMRLVDHSRVIWLPDEFSRLAKEGTFCFLAEPRAADGEHCGATINKQVAELLWGRCVGVSGREVR